RPRRTPTNHGSVAPGSTWRGRNRPIPGACSGCDVRTRFGRLSDLPDDSDRAMTEFGRTGIALAFWPDPLYEHGLGCRLGHARPVTRPVCTAPRGHAWHLLTSVFLSRSRSFPAGPEIPCSTPPGLGATTAPR